MLHCHVRYTVTFVTQTRLKRSVSGDVLKRTEMPDHLGERACSECYTGYSLDLIYVTDSIKVKSAKR